MYKPLIKFSYFPLINMYMENEYEKCKTYSDIVDFYHKWHNEMLVTKNEVKYEAIAKIIKPLYSFLTNKSYESQFIN